MMKKQICVMLCGVIAASVFGGEFKWSEWTKLSDDNQKAAYVKSNTEYNKEQAFSYFLAKLVVSAKVDKKTTSANMINSIDALVTESKLTGDQAVLLKCYLLHHGYWWCGLSKNKDDAYISAITAIVNNSEIVNMLKQSKEGKIFLACFYSDLKKYNDSVDILISLNNSASAFVTAVTYNLGQSYYTKTINALIENVTSVDSPNRLKDVIRCINKLNNPAYDEQIKPLLIVLNRQCYPKIQISEDWKKAVVQLQLLMKTYGL